MQARRSPTARFSFARTLHYRFVMSRAVVVAVSLGTLLASGWLLVGATEVEAAVLHGSVRGPSGPLAGAVVDVRLYDFSLTTLHTSRTLTTNASGTFETTLDPGRVEVDV